MYSKSFFRYGLSRPQQHRALSTSLRVPLVSSKKPEPAPESSIRESKIGDVRIISVNGGLPLSSVSIFTSAGSREEDTFTTGSSHFLSKLAYRGLTYMKTGLVTVRDLEHFGCEFSSATGKEFLSYHAWGPRLSSTALEVTLESLLTQLYPVVPEWQVSEVRPLVKLDIEHQSTENAMIQAAHFEGFPDSGLANPVVTPSWQADLITRTQISAFKFKLPKNFTVVATGVDHGELNSLATKILPTFHKIPENRRPLSKQSVEALKGQKPKVAPSWQGGKVVRNPGPDSTSQLLLAHSGVAFSSPKFHAFAVFVEILNLRLGSSANAFHTSYTDAGFLGIIGSGSDAKSLLSHFSASIKEEITQEQLDLAKKLAAFRLVSNLESPVRLAVELNVRGTSAFNQADSLSKVAAVSLDAVKDLAGRIAKEEPVVVVNGNVSGI